MSEEYVFRPKGTVAIRESHPFPGRVTILYTPPGAFQARALELPQTAFLEACRQLADRMTAKANGTAKRTTPSEAPKPVIRSLVRPVASGA